eukprot:359659_1
MGCLSGSEMSESEQDIDTAIASQIGDDRREELHYKKILLMGCTGSGKNTIVKQLKIIDGNGFESRERSQYIANIHKGIICKMKWLIKYCDGNQLSMESQQAIQHFNQIQSTHALDDKIICSIKTLWNERLIKHTYSLHKQDSRSCFFDDIDRIASPEYIPSDKDIMCCTDSNTKIREHRSLIRSRYRSYHVINPCGQRSSWKKYIDCFDDVAAVVFVASFSCYHQAIHAYDDDLDDLVFGYICNSYSNVYNIPHELILLIKRFCDVPDQGNAMSQQLKMFDNICNHHAFEYSRIILLLNKKDLFEEKLDQYPLDKFSLYKDFQGETSSYNDVFEYFQRLFESVDVNNNRRIFTQSTCATDINNIEKVFNDIQTVMAGGSWDTFVGSPVARS